jgi:hypothetical protein
MSYESPMRPCMTRGGVKWQMLQWCKCGDKRRGPVGGVCGRCAQAIPWKKVANEKDGAGSNV